MGLISRAKAAFARVYYPWRIKSVAAECGKMFMLEENHM